MYVLCTDPITYLKIKAFAICMFCTQFFLILVSLKPFQNIPPVILSGTFGHFKLFLVTLSLRIVAFILRPIYHFTTRPKSGEKLPQKFRNSFTFFCSKSLNLISFLAFSPRKATKTPERSIWSIVKCGRPTVFSTTFAEAQN